MLEVHERHDLGTLAQRHCGWTTLSYEEVAGKGASRIPFASVSVDRATAYAAEKADCVLALHERLYPQIEQDEKLKFVYGEIEMPVLPVLFRIERNGVLLDRAKLEAQSHELGKEILEKEQQAFAAAGQPFNLGSPKQIQEILFERQKLPVKKKTPSGQPSTDEDSLAELALDHPLPQPHPRAPRAVEAQVDLHRQAAEEREREDRARAHHLLADHRGDRAALVERPQPAEHPDPHPAGPAHPRMLHRAAGREDRLGRLLADRAAASWRTSRATRTCAAPSARARTCTARPPPKSSACRSTKSATDERRVAKVINFGLIYGMSSLRRGAEPRHRPRHGADLRRPLLRALSRARSATWTRRARSAQAVGYVETVFGRRLWLPELKSGAPVRRQAAERAAINAPMQGTAADLIKLAMIAVQKWLDEREAEDAAHHAGARRAGSRGPGSRNPHQ